MGCGLRSLTQHPWRGRARRRQIAVGAGVESTTVIHAGASAAMTIAMALILKINLGVKSRTKRMMKRMTKEKRAKMRLEVPNQTRQFVSCVLIAMAVDAATQDAVHAIDPSSLLKVSSRT
jgi:hypothetical protein